LACISRFATKKALRAWVGPPRERGTFDLPVPEGEHVTPDADQHSEPPQASLLERRLTMQLDVARMLAAASKLSEAARDLLHVIGEAEGFQAAALWRVDEATSELRCEEFWSNPGRPAPELERISRRTWLPKGELLPGRVWSTGQVIRLDDLAREPGFHRAFWAGKDSLRAAMAFPVSGGAEVSAVLELFSKAPRAVDPTFDEVMRSVCGQIGRFVRQSCAEEALRQAEVKLRRVLDHAPVVLFAFDREGRFTLSEGRGLPALGLRPNEVLGRSGLEMYRDVPEIVAAMRRALAGEAFVTTAELPALGLTYETRYTPIFDDAGAVVEVIGVATDVSERARAQAALRVSEARLVEADRLASLGTLAAGVAHEINNPLSYVILNLDQIMREVANLERVPAPLLPALRASIEPRLREARAGLARVQLIVQDLKAFSRVGSNQCEPCSVESVLDETLELCAAELRARARVVRSYGRSPPAMANRSRLGQVFLNLLLNAAQAIPEGHEGEHSIVLTTGTDELGRAMVSISDDGEGIPPDLLGRIFEPFFTTKPPGVGTGLGLSICHGIVSSLGGVIDVESRVGQGSTFRVVLPVASAAPEPESVRESAAPDLWAEAAEPSPELPRGRVLVVDDEPVLGSALGRSLEPDFAVTVVTSGREARRLLLEGPPFDVILCDLIMPEVTGMDLYEDVRRARPDLASRIIFMTGGTFTARAREFLSSVQNPALDKPFDLETLETMLRARIAQR
jgi:PAS domain S-box-containing protein